MDHYSPCSPRLGYLLSSIWLYQQFYYLKNRMYLSYVSVAWQWHFFSFTFFMHIKYMYWFNVSICPINSFTNSGPRCDVTIDLVHGTHVLFLCIFNAFLLLIFHNCCPQAQPLYFHPPIKASWVKRAKKRPPASNIRLILTGKRSVKQTVKITHLI